MKKSLGTFNTDQVNCYGYRFTIEALESALCQGWRGMPMFISHDSHRPIGVSRALGLHLHSSQTLLKGVAIFAETDDEQKIVGRQAQQYLAQKLSEVSDTDRGRLQLSFSNCMSTSATFLARECTCVVDPGIAKRAFPSLFSGDETDKRSLVPVRDLEEIGPGVFKMGEYAVFAHRYFRRSLSQINNLNSFFLEKLYKLGKETGLDVKIALDADSIGLADTYRTPIELERWRGPKFNDDLTAIEVGVTCHKASERERFFHGIDSTEFWWHKQNGKHSLECEEILDIPTLGIDEDTFGCRYVHSIVDESTELPDHLDGAIREYAAVSFLDRIEVDISKAGKNTRYVKLWRVDGALQLPKWKELICDFYMGNPLPGEYLLGSVSRDHTSGNQTSSTDDSGSRKIQEPPVVSEADSVHVAVSYHSLDDLSSAHDRSVQCLDKFVVGNRRLKTIELSAIDLIQSVSRSVSGKLELPDDISFIAFEDLDINFPLFLFQGSESLADAAKFLDRLIELCRSFVASMDSRFITASVGLRYDDFIAVFSFAGFASELVKAYESGIKEFPATHNDIGAWCSETQKTLHAVSGNSYLSDEMQKMFELTGCFSFPRQFSISEFISIDDKGQISARIPPSDVAVAQKLNDGALKVATACLIKKCSCSKCGGNYLDCACSVFTDRDCSISVDEFELLGFLLTERRA